MVGLKPSGSNIPLSDVFKNERYFLFQDGFYDGELLDGRRGLVPSNFIQKLVGDDLLEFHHSVIQGLRDGDDSASTNIPQDLDYHQLNTGQCLYPQNSA